MFKPPRSESLQRWPCPRFPPGSHFHLKPSISTMADNGGKQKCLSSMASFFMQVAGIASRDRAGDFFSFISLPCLPSERELMVPSLSLCTRVLPVSSSFSLCFHIASFDSQRRRASYGSQAPPIIIVTLPLTAPETPTLPTPVLTLALLPFLF